MDCLGILQEKPRVFLWNNRSLLFQGNPLGEFFWWKTPVFFDGKSSSHRNGGMGKVAPSSKCLCWILMDSKYKATCDSRVRRTVGLLPAGHSLRSGKTTIVCRQIYNLYTFTNTIFDSKLLVYQKVYDWGPCEVSVVIQVRDHTPLTRN